MVIRTYDELTDNEKNKFMVMNIWINNQMAQITWFILILAVILGIALALTSMDAFASFFFEIYLLLATIWIALILLYKIKRINKLAKLIFGVSDSPYSDFFGIKDEDVKVKFKELIKDLEKTQMKGRKMESE